MDMRAKVGLSTSTLFPLIVEGNTMGSNNMHWSQELGNLEPCCEDNDVVIVLQTRGADDPGLRNLLNAFGDELHVGLVQAVEVARIEDASLAA